GRLVKWAGIFGDQTYAVGDSSITEDKFGNVRIGNAFSGVRFSVSKAMPGDDGIFAEGGDARCQTCTGGLGVLGRGGNGLLFGGNGVRGIGGAGLGPSGVGGDGLFGSGAAGGAISGSGITAIGGQGPTGEGLAGRFAGDVTIGPGAINPGNL